MIATEALKKNAKEYILYFIVYILKSMVYKKNIFNGMHFWNKALGSEFV